MIPALTPDVSEGYDMSTPQVCDIPDCERPRYQGRRMCSTHVMRKHRYGDPLWTRPVRSVDLTGRRFGLLAVKERDGARNWTCRCDCGTTTSVRASSLTSGTTRSCGRHRRAENVGYSGMHLRLRRDYGPASQYPCVDCLGEAAQWSYSHEDPDELRSPDGPYSTDVWYYAPRCVPCHKAMDLAHLAGR